MKSKAIKKVLGYTPVVAGAKKLMSNFADNVDPFGYEAPFSVITNNAILNKKSTPRQRSEINILSSDRKNLGPAFKERIDLLQMLANKKQKYNSIPKSEYKPSVSRDKNKQYFRSPVTEEKLNNYINTSWIRKPIESREDVRDMRSESLGNVKLDYGTDKQGNYISYYDKWDLNPIPQTGINWIDKTVDKVVTGVPNMLGITNTPEVYGRVYLPNTNDITKKKYAEGGSFLSTNAGAITGLADIGGDIIDQTKFGKTRGGSALSGVVKGAAAGAALGPIGMGIGAALGGVSGLLKAGAQKRAESAQELDNRFRVNALLASNLPGQPEYVPTFKDGGFIPLEILGFIKADGGSIKSLTNNLDSTTYYPTGGTHQQNPHGGIPIGKDALVEQGEFRYDSKTKGSYIFSNKF